MAKIRSSFEISLHPRGAHQSVADWVYWELRTAILSGRLSAGTRLPATRELASRHGVSRGTVVAAFERLQGEGYVECRVGSGTWVTGRPIADKPTRSADQRGLEYIARARAAYELPKPFRGWSRPRDRQAFDMSEPAVDEFPVEIWRRLVARRSRTLRSWLRERDDGRGYAPLREVIAHYLGSSRGLRCSPDQIVVLSGIQQALQLLARVLLRPGDPVWMEDPGYFGASIAFRRAGALVVPVPVDEQGLSVSAGIRLCAQAKGAFLTPAHQFPMGVTMPLSRRVELLKWASRTGAFLIEDDYDSEYRFRGHPVPTLQGMDENGNVILVGTFTKLLFPALRLAYVVLPPALVNVFVALRTEFELHALGFEQGVLHDFIADGHFARHLRRMRSLYSERLQALQHAARQYLGGLLEVADVEAGLYTPAFLGNGMSSRHAEKLAAAHNVETRGLDRFILQCPDPKGLLLGFAAFDENELRKGVMRLGRALTER